MYNHKSIFRCILDTLDKLNESTFELQVQMCSNLHVHLTHSDVRSCEYVGKFKCAEVQMYSHLKLV